MTSVLDFGTRSRRGIMAVLAVILLAAGILVVDARNAPPAHSYPTGQGYWFVGADGGIFSFGDAQFFGSTGAIQLNEPIVGMAAYPFYEGYWFVGEDGGIFTFGSANFFGSTGDLTLNQPVVGMAAHPSGDGYWHVAADGGIFSFGAAGFHGSTGDIVLNEPIVGMAPTPSGEGYWLVAEDGGIFSFGDASFYGSMGAIPLNQPIVGMTATESGMGYWFVAADGGIFAFGDALFYGSMGDVQLNEPIVGMEATPSGGGYWFVGEDGGIFSFGDAQFHGSTGAIQLNLPIVGMAARPDFAIKVDAFDDSAGEVSEWRQIGGAGGDWQLFLDDNDADEVAAGARVLGVEGLDVSQLQTISYHREAGACGSSLRVLIYADTTGDGVADTTAVYNCADGGAGATKSFSPTAGGQLAGADRVMGIDIIQTSATATRIDDITVAGLTVTDSETVRAS
jgi:ribosomal protein L24E